MVATFFALTICLFRETRSSLASKRHMVPTFFALSICLFGRMCSSLPLKDIWQPLFCLDHMSFDAGARRRFTESGQKAPWSRTCGASSHPAEVFSRQARKPKGVGVRGQGKVAFSYTLWLPLPRKNIDKYKFVDVRIRKDLLPEQVFVFDNWCALRPCRRGLL